MARKTTLTPFQEIEKARHKAILFMSALTLVLAFVVAGIAVYQLNEAIASWR